MNNITKEQVLENLETVKNYISEIENKKGEKVVGIAIKSVLGEIIFQSTKSTYREAIIEKGNANLSDANLYSANLSDANLSDANLHSADLSDADLSGANLHGADLSDADLHGADLSGANLSDANLYSADLSDANLSDANLHGADLSDADLSDANLSGAELHNAKFYGKGGTKKLTKEQLPDFLNALGFQVKR